MFEYIFRFCADPGFNDKTEIESLAAFADAAGIDDVCVFANVEEINTGHMTADEQAVYIDMMRCIRDKMKSRGITVSVNQWHSVMHADLGKQLHADQHFRLMRDLRGRQATLSVCPLCKEWQQYIGDIYAAYTVLEPSILWVEDDFRLHNHAPLEWGGCFCDEHMRLYEEAAGERFTREELVKKMLAPGRPHQARKAWLDVSRETMLQAARAIHDAVREKGSHAKIGLMSSVPFVHAAEGRDWELLLNTLCEGAQAVNRPHLPGYQELTPARYLQGMNMVSMMTAALVPAGTLLYPELENYPYSHFSKSCRFTRFQIVSVLPLNVAGIAMDLFDLNGNGIVMEDDYQSMLKEVKPFLNAMTDNGIFAKTKRGVAVIYNRNSSYTIHTETGEQMEELYPREVFFAGLLPAMGIPFYYREDIHCEGEIIAVSGQVLRNYSEEEIKSLFEKNKLVLCGDAIETLYDMRLGYLCGITNAVVRKQDEGYYSYEQVNGDRMYAGRKKARASAVISCSDAVEITYSPDSSVNEYSAFYDSFRKRRFSGQTVVENKVFLFPFTGFENPLAIPPMLLNRVRQELLADAISSFRPDFPLVMHEAYLEPYCYLAENGLGVYLVNAATDDVARIYLRLPTDYCVADMTLMHSEGGREISAPWKQEGDVLCIESCLKSMEAVYIGLDKND